jgi:hypothetical protein
MISFALKEKKARDACHMGMTFHRCENASQIRSQLEDATPASNEVAFRPNAGKKYFTRFEP